LVPIVLYLVTPRDIAETKGMRSQTRRTKIVRLFRQAYEQKDGVQPRSPHGPNDRSLAAR